MKDTFPPVLWVRDRLAGGWRERTETDTNLRPRTDINGTEHVWIERKDWSPYWLKELITCPWCASGWVSLAVTSNVWAWYGLPYPVLVWFAVWSGAALLASQEWA